MLSYRHSFHAGNFADIIKHVVLVETLGHLTNKESPFEYIDSYSGAGLFNLHSKDAKKLGEHHNGIGKLTANDYPELSDYFAAINSYNKSGEIHFYPGSPSIAKYFLRQQDRAWLYELHPQDYKSLCKDMENSKKIRVFCQDGLKALESILPPTSRRGLILIDPSYEIKSEYEQVFHAFVNAYKKFSTGTYIIWYPVVDRRQVDVFEKKMVLSGIKNIQRFELGLSPDTKERGMTSSGVFVVNPPWTLFEKMSTILPRLAKTLGNTNDKFYKCDILSAE
ncbi:MAG: 23S rRNA (adenine(2030)-N(6))-methyltransferase RlmJ [Oceanicoccus sp.]